MERRASIFLLIGLWAGSLAFAGAPRVIATTGWTAAFASLAGAEDVTVLAPYDMKHPPEYELSLAELQQVAQADFIVFAGYEAMMQRIKEALGDQSRARLIQIKTVNSYPVIAESVLRIAEALGTEERARENLAEVKGFLTEWKEELASSGASELTGAVHFHQQGPAKWLGLRADLIFGPPSPSLAQIREVLSLKPALVIDNLHNPVAAPFLEQNPPPRTVRWINFPGTAGTVSLLDVLRYNRRELNRALEN